jgi:hypothetical protein
VAVHVGAELDQEADHLVEALVGVHLETIL